MIQRKSDLTDTTTPREAGLGDFMREFLTTASEDFRRWKNAGNETVLSQNEFRKWRHEELTATPSQVVSIGSKDKKELEKQIDNQTKPKYFSLLFIRVLFIIQMWSPLVCVCWQFVLYSFERFISSKISPRCVNSSSLQC